MTRKELIKYIIDVLEVDALPLTLKLINEKFQEYELAYFKDNVRAYHLGQYVPEYLYDIYARAICEIYGISMDQLKSNKREMNLVLARAHFCKYMRYEHKATFTALAKYLNRDHTSIIHYLKRYKLPNIDRETITQTSVQIP